MECSFCKKEFKAKRDTAKYCSSRCRKLAFLKVSVPLKSDVSVLHNKPKYPQGFCHSCGKGFAEIFKNTGCICLECVNKGVTHASLGLDINVCK